MRFNSDRKSDLIKSYQKEADKLNDKKDFEIADLEKSRLLFQKASILKKEPIPINVNVIAILSGISFDIKTLTRIDVIIKQIEKLLKDEIFYFVKPENLGVEIAILKWPDNDFNKELVKNAITILKNKKILPFSLNIFGIQVHTDGCIILRGLDERNQIYNLREELLHSCNGIPKKQSNWSHIPLGRILSPIGVDKMKELKQLISKINLELNFNINIDKIHLVRETQWYMEKKLYILTKELK